MAKKYTVYWYRESEFIRNAALCNCRDRDLSSKSGARIDKESIIAGAIGYAVAEKTVPGYVGKTVRFKANRQCEWLGLTLCCMAHPYAPVGKATKTALRPYNYIVAELANGEAIGQAKRQKLKIIQTANGHSLVNLEVSSFERQGAGSSRRAKLI